MKQTGISQGVVKRGGASVTSTYPESIPSFYAFTNIQKTVLTLKTMSKVMKKKLIATIQPCFLY